MAAQTAARYAIDASLSRLIVKVTAGGFLSAMGHDPTIAARDFAGEASFVPETLDQASLRLSVRPDSFEVTDDVSEKDRREMESTMKQEVLETSRFPEITFQSSKISPTQLGTNQFAVNIAGDLTLHGVKRPQTIICQVSVTGDTLRGSGEFSLRQTDYGLKLVSVAGGALKVKDEVKCSFDIVARKQS
jgi:polyisoprenoid-binding protein YceI